MLEHLYGQVKKCIIRILLDHTNHKEAFALDLWKTNLANDKGKCIDSIVNASESLFAMIWTITVMVDLLLS